MRHANAAINQADCTATVATRERPMLEARICAASHAPRAFTLVGTACIKVIHAFTVTLFFGNIKRSAAFRSFQVWLCTAFKQNAQLGQLVSLGSFVQLSLSALVFFIQSSIGTTTFCQNRNQFCSI